MRLVKYQAWDKQNKMMFCDVQNGIDFDDGSHYKFSDFLSTPDRWELREYTGLKDKNGKEIYEGDMCRFWYKVRSKENQKENLMEEKFQVLYGFHKGDMESSSFYGWLEKNYGYICPLEDRQKWEYSNPYWDLVEWGYEVIGNIYTTPELLTNN